MLLRRRATRVLHRRGRPAAGLPTRRRRTDPQARADPRSRSLRPRRTRGRPHRRRPGLRRARDPHAAVTRGGRRQRRRLPLTRRRRRGPGHVQRPLRLASRRARDRVPPPPPGHDRAARRPQLRLDRGPGTTGRARGRHRRPPDRRRQARGPPARPRRGALRQRRRGAHAHARDERPARLRAADLLRRRVGRQRPHPPPARRPRTSRGTPAPPARRGRVHGPRAAARRRRCRRHLPAQRLHPRPLLPGAAHDHDVRPAAPRHLRRDHAAAPPASPPPPAS